MTKLKLKFNSLAGFVDPISIIGVLFLIVTLVIGTKVTNDRNFLLNMAEKAWIPKEVDLNKNSSLIGDNKNNSVKTNKNDEDDEEPAQQPTSAPEATPPFKTCDANGTKYSPGAVVMYGGIGSNATCGEDGKWNVGVGATKDIKPENLPEYAKESDKLKKQIEDEEAVAEAEKQVIQEQEKQDLRLEKVQEVVIPTQNKDDVYVPSIKPVVTTSQINLADIIAGVTSGTIPSSSKPYVPPLLPTVPTAEDLLRKLPGLENLNINDFKELNYPTINKPDPTIITNKYGIVGALDNSQNISWFDQPLDIPTPEFNLESTKPTIESEIKKLTDPLFNYIMDYINKYLPIKFK